MPQRVRRAAPIFRWTQPFDRSSGGCACALGQVYELMGDYRNSVVALQQALCYASKDLSLWSCLWVDYMKLGNAAEAAHAKATLAGLDAPSRKDGISRAAADVLSTAKQQHEAYLHARAS